MASPKVLAGLIVAGIIVVLVIALVATSLKKLSSDQSKLWNALSALYVYLFVRCPQMA